MDFSDIRRFPPWSHPGIVLFRPVSYGVAEVSRYVSEFVSTADLSGFVGCLVVVEPIRVRVRRAPEEILG